MSVFHFLHLLGPVTHLLPATEDDRHFVCRAGQAQDFRVAADPCTACAYSFYEHRYAPLASTWADDGLERDILLWQLLDERRWSQVVKITPGPRGGGLMAAYAFRCPVKRNAAWFTMYFPVDDTEPPSLTGKGSLDLGESWRMLKLLKDVKWQLFQ